jgi:predicted alpha/beta hydrolase family esterase
MLVAPADPERFDQFGVKRWHGIGASESIRAQLPTHALPVPSLLIASDNDPWMQASKSRLWGDCWGSRTFTLKDAGHINTASGFGPWPDGLKLFNHFKSYARSYQKPAEVPVFNRNFSLIQFNDNQSTFSCFPA